VGRHDHVRRVAAGVAVDPVAPDDLAPVEEVRQVAMLEIPRLVDERQVRPERHGVREVDHLGTLRPQNWVGLVGAGVLQVAVLVLQSRRCTPST